MNALICYVSVPQAWGRRPAGLAPLPFDVRDVGSYMARAAWLEAASVTAFERLASDLERFGAPWALVTAARQAAMDEARHARWTGRIASRYGAAGRVPHVECHRHPTLEELAEENATEGCAIETYGAALNVWQARSAESGAIRSVMARIAHDEIRHAALSFQIDDWARRRFGPVERARLDAARRRGWARVRRSLDESLPEPVAAVLGLPTPARARAILAALEVSTGLAGCPRDGSSGGACAIRGSRIPA